MCCVVFFQAEDGIRDLVRSRGLGDVYKRQASRHGVLRPQRSLLEEQRRPGEERGEVRSQPQDVQRPDVAAGAPPGGQRDHACLLYTSDAADERSSVDLGGRRILKKTKNKKKKRKNKKHKKK